MKRFCIAGTGAVVAFLLLAASAGAGENVKLTGGETTRIALTFDEELFQSAKLPEDWRENVDDTAHGAVYMPKSLKGRRADRVLVVFGPKGQNFDSMPLYVSRAEELRALLIACQHRIHETDERAHFYYTLRLLDVLDQGRRLDGQYKAIVAGHSGGGKMAMIVGAWGGKYFDGILAIAVNQDLASWALKQCDMNDGYATRIVLLNGTRDPIVTANHTQKVLASLQGSRFLDVTFRSYDGDHRFPADDVLAALKDLFEGSR